MKLGYWNEASKAMHWGRVCRLKHHAHSKDPACQVSAIATQLCPEDHKAVREYALIQNIEACHACVQAYVSVPVNVEAWFRRACALEGLGDLLEAQHREVTKCRVKQMELSHPRVLESVLVAWYVLIAGRKMPAKDRRMFSRPTRSPSYRKGHPGNCLRCESLLLYVVFGQDSSRRFQQVHSANMQTLTGQA